MKTISILKFLWKFLWKLGGFIVGLVLFLAGLVTIFPDLREYMPEIVPYFSIENKMLAILIILIILLILLALLIGVILDLQKLYYNIATKRRKLDISLPTPKEKVAITQSVEQDILKVTQNDKRLIKNIPKLIELIIDSEENHHTLENYLSKNISPKIQAILIMQPIVNFIPTANFIEKPSVSETGISEINYSIAPYINDIGEPENITPKNPTNNNNKSIDIKFDLNVIVHTYALISELKHTSNEDYSYPIVRREVIDKYCLKITGVVSIRTDNEIFDIMSLSSLRDQEIEKKINDMYIDSSIDIESIENRDAPNS